MLKRVLSVIAGYLVMAVLVFSLYTLLLYALGTERTYKPGSWEPSNIWIALSFVTGLIAAFVGGWVCLRISRDARTATWLMGLILILGIISVAAQATAPAPTEPRPAEVSPGDAASKSVTPLWVGITHIATGLAGVWLARRSVRL